MREPATPTRSHETDEEGTDVDDFDDITDAEYDMLFQTHAAHLNPADIATAMREACQQFRTSRKEAISQQVG